MISAPTSLYDLPFKTLAIVSGKGGSGKTLFATTLMLVLDQAGVRTILVDGDTGTGGLSYYLGLRYIRSIQVGLTELLVRRNNPKASRAINAMISADQITERDEEEQPNPSVTIKASVPISRLLQPISETKSARLLPVGNHTEILDPSSNVYRKSIGAVIRSIAAIDDCDLVIFDCRGGIDADSLAVCKDVDGILLVAETDAAAVRASENLVSFLTSHLTSRRHGKLVGFVINKAFADPTQLASASTSFFKTQYLGSIPFDFGTTRRFIFGQFPVKGSIFSSSVQAIAERLFPKISFPVTTEMSAADYGKLSLRDPDSVVGGRACAAVILIVLYLNISAALFPGNYIINILPIDLPYPIRYLGYPILDFVAAMAGIAGSLYGYRRMLGRAIRVALGWVLTLRSKSSDSGAWG
jgi:septum site-determining protein MinD